MLMKKLISQGIIYFLAAASFVLSQFVFAEDKLLSPEQAFSFSVESPQSHTAKLSWQIQPNYYLYQHKFTVQQGNQPLALKPFLNMMRTMGKVRFITIKSTSRLRLNLQSTTL